MTGGGAWVGVDLGTQSVRVMAVTSEGRVLGRASRSLASSRDGVRHEQDPHEWWSAFCAAAREALAGVHEPTRGVAVCGTSGTVLVVDRRGEPLTPGIMYDDGRASAELDRVDAVGEHLFAKLGYRRMQAVWGLPKACWLLRNHSFPAGARLAHQADFVTERLAGRPVATDLSNALKTGCDTVDERWPFDVMQQLGIEASMLPPIVRSGTVIGQVGQVAAEACGIDAGTPIVAGMTDGCASQLASGATSIGSWNTVLGTTLVFKGSTAELVHDPSGIVYSHRAPEGGWLPGGASSSGAGALSKHLPGADLDSLAVQAAHVPSDIGVAYPLVSDSGERFPFVASDARAFFANPADSDDAVRSYAALTRGMAAIERLGFDYLSMLGAPVDGEIRFTGGASHSEYLNRLRATMLGREVVVPRIAEPAFGMAVLAASHEVGIAGASASMIAIGGCFEPDPGIGPALLEAYLEFIEELECRGWLPGETATHAKERAQK